MKQIVNTNPSISISEVIETIEHGSRGEYIIFYRSKNKDYAVVFTEEVLFSGGGVVYGFKYPGFKSRLSFKGNTIAESLILASKSRKLYFLHHSEWKQMFIR